MLNEEVFFMCIRDENEKQVKTMRDNFKLLRQRKKWSMEELSQVSEIETSVLAGIENGDDFDVAFLIALCHIYGVKPCQIFLPIT